MNKQEVFNKVAVHLLTQKKQSSNNKVYGSYRGNNGLKCAIGALIDDKHYFPSMEGRSVRSMVIQQAIINSGNWPENLPGDQGLEFFSQLQLLHDCIPPSGWEEELKVFAQQQNLSPAVLN